MGLSPYILVGNSKRERTMGMEIKGRTTDFERLHKLAVRKYGCQLVRRDNQCFRAIVPEAHAGDIGEIRRDIMSLRGVTEVAA